MEHPDTRKVALEFLESKKSGVLSTLSPANEPRARLVYYSCDDEFNVYFLTMANTRKAEDLAAHPKAAFTVADEDAPRTIQMEGDVADITNMPAEDTVIETLFHNLKMNAEYYAPLARLDRGDVRFYRLTPTWVRFGNYVAGHSTSETQFEIAL